METINKMIKLIKENKLIVIPFIILSGMIVIIIFSLSSTTTNDQESVQQGSPSPAVSIRPQEPITQYPFSVVKTSPFDGETNVFPGEIQISIETDREIISPDSFSLSITPAIPYYWKVKNTFPTQEIVLQIYGGLAQNTEYTVEMTDNKQTPVYTWSFTTSAEEPENSSQLVKDQEEKEIKEFYPLFNDIPYEGTDFNIDYTDKLTLLVQIKNPDRERVEKEVFDWIKRHGVDPATHQIIYEDSF